MRKLILFITAFILSLNIAAGRMNHTNFSLFPKDSSRSEEKVSDDNNPRENEDDSSCDDIENNVCDEMANNEYFKSATKAIKNLAKLGIVISGAYIANETLGLSYSTTTLGCCLAYGYYKINSIKPRF